jgi:GR25 family glycosyltransferase involved in LPS biosynthesis
MITHTYFLCNPEKEQDRYFSLLKQINMLNLSNYTIFQHIWGTEITNEMREKWVKTDTTMKYHGRNMLSNPLSNEEISLFLTHIECLKEIRNKYRDGFFCVFESDVLFYESYHKKIENILKLAEAYPEMDIINIGAGAGGIHSTPKSEPIRNELWLYKEKINKCAEGILWTYKGVCKFLEYFESTMDIDGPYDTKMDVYSEYVGGFNIYWANPPLVCQGSVVGIFKSLLR